MKIAIIGAGNIGGTLAKGWVKAGHSVVLGIRNTASEKAMQFQAQVPEATLLSVGEAASSADLIVIATPAGATRSVTEDLGDVSGKIIIDTMNAVRDKPDPYSSTFDALKSWTGADVVKAFNCTGFETLANPHFGDQAVEMFMAGGSPEARNLVRSLALDLGFADCIDLGDDSKVSMLESFAMLWINLAFFQGQGRDFAFKMLKRH